MLELFSSIQNTSGFGYIFERRYYDLMKLIDYWLQFKVWHKNNIEHRLRNTTISAMHGIGSIMLWGYFSSNGAEVFPQGLKSYTIEQFLIPVRKLNIF